MAGDSNRTTDDDADAVESPCINQCTLVDGVCTGCQRTLPEIASWGTMSTEERAAVLNRIRNDDE